MGGTCRESVFTEETLCAEFKVSRSPVREALQMLADHRLVEKKPRQGYAVKQLNLTEIHELYDVRLVLETYIIEQVCKTGLDRGALATLRRRWTGLYEALPEMIADPVGVDENFHSVLAQAVGNQAMIELLRNIDNRIRFVRMFDITNSDRLKATCMQHLEILDAIGDRDGGKAIEALRRNVEGGRTQVESAVKEALANAHAIYG